MALRATEGNEKPAGGEDAANEWRVEARRETGSFIFPANFDL
jgi:hypothetical protein